MATAAIIVGIDAYVDDRQLTSAVNDADAFRQALLTLGLVPDERNIRVLTAPVGEPRSIVRKKDITDALYDFYVNGDDIDRLYFFYAGHGLLAYSDAARMRSRTVLMPNSVEDLNRDGLELIDLNEVLDRLRLVGPREQFFFIDACRDLPYDRHPDVGSLGWGQRDPHPEGARSQVVLYAVSPFGRAIAQARGMGVMTTHLLDALRGAGVALDYDPILDQYVVTGESAAAYVREAVGSVVADQPRWEQVYMLPELNPSGPKASPIRVVDAVTPAPLTIHIDPDAAAAQTNVSLAMRRITLNEYCLPPRQNHETVLLEPQIYAVTATSALGTPQPQRRNIDVRKEHEITISVAFAPGAVRRAAAMPTAGPPLATVAVTAPMAESFAETGAVDARALEPGVKIEIVGLEPPHDRWSGYWSINQPVPVGPYSVRFSLGANVFSQTDIYVQSGETVDVSANADMPPLLREAMAIEDEVPRTTEISESIGEMQAAVLPTLLPIVGIKPFDVHNELFHRFQGAVPAREPREFGWRPFSLVVAVDGNNWPATPRAVLESVRCGLVLAENPGAGEIPVELETLARAGLDSFQPATPTGRGLERIGLGLIEAPSPSFFLTVRSPYVGSFTLACASIWRRATVVTVTLHPGGSFDLSQNLLRLPGLKYTGELAPDVPYGRMLRDLQLGQCLYHSGEFFQNSGNVLPTLVNDLVYAKWTDPILSCMAYYAWRDALERNEPWAGPARDVMRVVAENLSWYFPDLPDSRIIQALTFDEQRIGTFWRMLGQGVVPVLADSARALARHGEEIGQSNAAVVEVARRIPPGQIWSLTLDS